MRAPVWLRTWRISGTGCSPWGWRGWPGAAFGPPTADKRRLGIRLRTDVRKTSASGTFDRRFPASGVPKHPSPEMGCFTLTMNCRIAVAVTDH